MDDILIHTETFDKLKKLTDEVFGRLQNMGLTFNLEKTFFGFQSIKYLGRLISQGQIKLDPKTVEVLKKLKNLTNITELRGLIGLIGYFQKYILHYEHLMKPLFQLLATKGMSSRKNKKIRIEWDEKNEQFKKEILNIIADAVLQIPIEIDSFVIETDASNKRIGLIFSVERGDKLIPVEVFLKTFAKSSANGIKKIGSIQKRKRY